MLAEPPTNAARRIASKYRRGCLPHRRRQCPRTWRKTGPCPLRGGRVAAGRVQGVCGTTRLAARGCPIPGPGVFMRDTVQTYRQHALVRMEHSPLFCLKERRDRDNAGVPGSCCLTGSVRRAAPCPKWAGKAASGSVSGSICAFGTHGAGRSFGTAIRQPGRFLDVEGLIAFGLGLPAGTRVCGFRLREKRPVHCQASW